MDRAPPENVDRLHVLTKPGARRWRFQGKVMCMCRGSAGTLQLAGTPPELESCNATTWSIFPCLSTPPCWRILRTNEVTRADC